MKNILKHQWYRAISGIGFVTILIGGCASIPPPNEQIAVARTAMSNAATAGAQEFAPADMRTAQDKLDRAINAMAAKDNGTARTLAEQAQVDAELAAAKARSAKAQQAAAAVQKDNETLRQEINRKTQ